MFDNIWFQILVFTGLVFLLAWTFFVFYFARKVLAYIHKRVGPHFNGPAGSLQTIFDIFKLLTKENITPKTFRTLSHGGNVDACGFAVAKKSGRIAWIRLPVPCHLMAAYLAEKPELLDKLAKDAQYALFHARKTTSGEPYINRNNHPFCDKETRLCLVHNGSIKLRYYNKETNEIEALAKTIADTDSAVLLAALVKWYRENADKAKKGEELTLFDAAKEAWGVFEGKASIAVFKADTMELLYTKNYRADIYAANIAGSIVLATASETILALKPGLVSGGSLVSGDTLNPLLKQADKYYSLSNITIYWRRGSLEAYAFKELVEAGTSKGYYYYGSRSSSYEFYSRIDY
jgi:hypothetical protein